MQPQKKKSHSLEMLEQSYDDISSPMRSNKKSKNDDFTKDTLQFMLRVLNSSLIFSSITLPYYFQMIGIVLGVLTFVLLFTFSFIESTLLLDLKYYARSRLKPGTLNSIFKLFKIPKYIADIYRVINIINANLYVVLLLSIFQQGMQAFFLTVISKSQPTGLLSQQFIQFCGTVLIMPFFVKWIYPVYMIALARLLGILSILSVAILGFSQMKTNHYSLAHIMPYGNVVEIWTTIPCVMLAFAYHQQFFTGKLNYKPNKDEDAEKKLKMGAFYGSLLLMSFDCLISIFAAYGYFFVQLGSNKYGNLIAMVQEDGISNSNNVVFVTYMFYILISISAQLQVIQYVPQAVVMILNVVDPKRRDDDMKEIMLVEQGSDQTLNPKKQLPSKMKLKSQVQQSLILHEGEKLRLNYQPSIIAACVFYLIAFLIAMCEPPILLISCLMGCLTQNFITFLIPSILYLDSQFALDSNPYKKCFAWFSIIFSVSFALVGTSFGMYALYMGYV